MGYESLGAMPMNKVKAKKKKPAAKKGGVTMASIVAGGKQVLDFGSKVVGAFKQQANTAARVNYPSAFTNTPAPPGAGAKDGKIFGMSPTVLLAAGAAAFLMLGKKR